jgi:hypothetical protein
MSNNTQAMDRRLVLPLAATLCETFFFGANIFLDPPSCVTETGEIRALHSFVCLFDFFHAVGTLIQAACSS